MLESLWQDLGYAVRSLLRTPGFATAAILTLALGIGANTAIFSLIEAVLLRPLPVAAPEELAFIAHGTGSELSTASNYPWLERVRQRTDVFVSVTAFNIRDFKLSSGDGVETVSGQYVSGNYHALAGVPIALGRGFASERDDAPGSSPIAVISDGYWTRRFGRSRDAIGRTLVVGGHLVTVVGVTAPGFVGMQPGRSLDVTLPLSVLVRDEPDFLTSYDSWTSMPLIARLRPDVTVAQAETAVQSAFREHMNMPETRPFSRTSRGELRSAVLLPAAKGHDRLRRDYELPLHALMGMVGIVLLIGCVNVSGLLLSRGSARVHEVTVRLSVGASRGRLLRQLLTESLVLGLGGGVVGVVLAGWATQSIATLFRESQNPIVIEAQPDGAVLLFATVVSLLTGLAVGLAPALGAIRVPLSSSLKQTGTVTGPRSLLVRRALVVAQIALCLVLTFGAGLLVRTLRNLQGVEGGFETERVLVLALDARDTAFPAERVASLCADAIERMRSRPGVVSGSCSTMSPVDTAMEVRLLGIPNTRSGPGANEVMVNTVTPDYFQTFGIDLVRGRLFTPTDAASAPRVAIVNEGMARFHFGGADPIGRPIGFGRTPDPARTMTIVGVVRDARQTPRDAPPRMVYQPLDQILEAPEDLTVAVRTAGTPTALAAAAREDVRALSRDVAVRWVRTMRQQIDGAMVRERLLAGLSTTFGLLALVLACIGLYGVMSYDVARRRREIGIRLALGADQATVLAAVFRPAAGIVAMGVAVGLITAVLASRLVSAFLFELTPRDPLTLGLATAALAGTGLLAGYLPARRAARIDPAVVLRAE